jgi:hypothetical protein
MSTNATDKRPEGDDGDDRSARFASKLAQDFEIHDIIGPQRPLFEGDDGLLWKHNAFIRLYFCEERASEIGVYPIQYRRSVAEIHEYVVAQALDPRNADMVGTHRYFTFEIEMGRFADLRIPGYAFKALDPDEHANRCSTGELLALRTQFNVLDAALRHVQHAAQGAK